MVVQSFAESHTHESPEEVALLGCWPMEMSSRRLVWILVWSMGRCLKKPCRQPLREVQIELGANWNQVKRSHSLLVAFPQWCIPRTPFAPPCTSTTVTLRLRPELGGLEVALISLLRILISMTWSIFMAPTRTSATSTTPNGIPSSRAGLMTTSWSSTAVRHEAWEASFLMISTLRIPRHIWSLPKKLWTQFQKHMCPSSKRIETKSSQKNRSSGNFFDVADMWSSTLSMTEVPFSAWRCWAAAWAESKAFWCPFLRMPVGFMPMSQRRAPQKQRSWKLSSSPSSGFELAATGCCWAKGASERSRVTQRMVELDSDRRRLAAFLNSNRRVMLNASPPHLCLHGG